MSDLIDYAHPLMMAERDYELALDQLKLAIVETRAASAATLHMQEKSNALR